MANDFESLGFAEVGESDSLGFKPVAAEKNISYFPKEKNRFADLGFVETEDNLTTGDRLSSAGASVLRGAGAILTSIPKGIAIAKKGVDEFVPGLKYVPTMAMLIPPDTVIEKTNAIENWVSELAPAETESLKDSWLWQKFPRGVGSALGFLAGGAAGSAVKIPAWLSSASLGTLATYKETYEDAKKHGADEETALAAAFTSTPLGASEAVPMARWVNRLNKGSSGTFKQVLMNSTKETLEEAMQEAFQQGGQDLIAKGFYDPNRELFKDVREAAATGGAVGLFMSLLTQTVGNAMGRRRGRTMFPDDTESTERTEPAEPPKINIPPEFVEVSPAPTAAPTDQPQQLENPIEAAAVLAQPIKGGAIPNERQETKEVQVAPSAAVEAAAPVPADKVIEERKQPEEPLGISRPEKQDAGLRQLSDEEFDEHFRNAKGRVNDAEKALDELDRELTREERSRLGVIQDRWAAADLERYRRNQRDIVPADLFFEMRQLVGKIDKNNPHGTQAFERFKIVAEEMARQKATLQESTAEMSEYPKRLLSDPTFQESLRGQAGDIKLLLQKIAEESNAPTPQPTAAEGTPPAGASPDVAADVPRGTSAGTGEVGVAEVPKEIATPKQPSASLAETLKPGEAIEYQPPFSDKWLPAKVHGGEINKLTGNPQEPVVRAPIGGKQIVMVKTTFATPNDLIPIDRVRRPTTTQTKTPESAKASPATAVPPPTGTPEVTATTSAPVMAGVASEVPVVATESESSDPANYKHIDAARAGTKLRITSALAKSAASETVYIAPQSRVKVRGKERLINNLGILKELGAEMVEANRYRWPKPPKAQPAESTATPPTDVSSPKQSSSAASGASTPTVAQPTAADKPVRVARGSRMGNLLKRETELTGPDIIDWMVDNMKMLSKSDAKRTRGKEWWQSNQSEYDGAAPLAKPHHNQIYGGTSTPNKVAQAAFQAGQIKEQSVDALWDAINKSSAVRGKAIENSKLEAKLLENEQKTNADWLKATEKGSVRVKAEDLQVGDVLDVEGERVKVTEIDPDTHEVTLEDGSKFGTQTLADGSVIHVEHYKSAPKDKGELFSAEETPFNLAGEKAKPVELVEPKVETTGYGTEKLAQDELFAIQKIVESKDPTKSADAAQKLYGSARAAANKIEEQLAVVDSDKDTKKAFAKEQRARLKEVLALLRQRSKQEPQSSVASGEGVATSIEGGNDEAQEISADPVGKENLQGGVDRLAEAEVFTPKMAEDLSRSGKVLWARGNEIIETFAAARGLVPGLRAEGTEDVASKVGIHSGEEQQRREVFEKTRIFVEELPENRAPATQRQIDFLAHRLLFGNDDRAQERSGDFLKVLVDRLGGLKIIFEHDPNNEVHVHYRPRGKGAFDGININTSELAKYDFASPAHVDYWVASLVEEVLHAVTFRVASEKELSDVWDSLSSDERARVAEIYKADIKNDTHRGAEYVRMILQERVFGHTTEVKKTTITEAIRGILRKAVALLKEAFGQKPQNDIARQIVERIEGIIQGEAPISQSIFGESQTPIGASPDKPVADILQRGEREEAGDDYIPTEVMGVEMGVLGKAQWTPEARAKSLAIAKAAFDEAGVAVEREGEGHWKMVPSTKAQNPAGRKLIEIMKREIGKYGQASLEVTELIQSVRLDFYQGRMDEMFSLPVRSKLDSIAQGDASFRGVVLNALRGAYEDLRFVSKNIDVYLQRIWHEAYGGKEIDDTLGKIREKFRAFFTPEVIAEIVEANPALKALKGSTQIISDGLDTEFANLGELRDTYAGLLSKAGVKESLALARQIIEALRPRIKLAADGATRDAEGKLTAEEKVVLKGRKPIWQKIVEAVQRGEFDNGPLLREKARANGWKPPSDEEIARIKRLAERERTLQQLSKKELDAAAGDQSKIKREQIIRDEATLPRRLPLMRQMEAEWGNITRPVNFGKGIWKNRANNAAFINELMSANILFRASFAPKQAISVLSQFAFHIPTRAIAQAIETHGQAKDLGQQTALAEDVYLEIKGAFKSALAGYKDGVAQFVAALKGRGEARNVDRLTSGIAAIERLDAQAEHYKEQGKTGMAILFKVMAFIRLGYRIAQAFDNLQGVPSEYIEMRHQAVMGLMKNGLERHVANAQADNIIESIKADHVFAMQEAKAFLEEQGEKVTPEKLREISYRIARRWAYENMRTLGLPADDFAAQNRQLRETIGWNEREVGIDKGLGGSVGAVVSGFGKFAEKLGVPLAMGRFGNAIAISINRLLHFTPIGFFPGAFGGENNAWFRTELDRNQRKVEATVGTMFQSMAFLLALSGVFAVRLRWPEDKEERDLFEAQGHRPGTLEIPHGDGSFTAVSLNTGFAQFLAPGLAAGGALRDLLEQREKRQEKLNADAAKKGLTPETIRPMSTADMMGVAAQAAYHTILGGRTASGSIASFSDYGTPNVIKGVASQVSPAIPLLPAMQEISRMSGVVLDAKMATFTDFLLPLPSSPARRVNFLGDPAGTPDDLQRIVQILTGGSYWNVNPEQSKAAAAYRTLFDNAYRPPSVNPNKGYAIGNAFRPFNDAELENYTQLRGQEFKSALGELPANADTKAIRGAYRLANGRALARMGVTGAVRKTSTRSRKGLRSRLRNTRRRFSTARRRSSLRFSYAR